MSSTLQLNQINILQLNQCDSEKLRFLSPQLAPATAPDPAVPKPLTALSEEDIDNANRVGRRQNDNNTCSYHSRWRGEILCDSDSDSVAERSCGTATKDSLPTYNTPPTNYKVGIGAGGSECINSTCKGICCTVVESVQCASALVDTHHDVGNGTLTTVDSNFKCLSTVSGFGRVTCAVLPQRRPLECVHRRCYRNERLATATAPPASSIQEPSQVDKHIGKHLRQASYSKTFATNTYTTTTTSWASTSSVSSVSCSPTSVQDFAKCLTAEEKVSSPSKRTQNSLAKGPLSTNSCDFVLSEVYFSPFGDVFCYNLDPCLVIQAETLQDLLNDSLGHFCHSKRIFLVVSQSSHSQWLASSSVLADAGQPNPISVTPLQKFNYLILSASNLNNTLWFINNELVNNLNENLYFLPIQTSSSAPIPSTPSLSSSKSVPGAKKFCKSSRLREDIEKQPTQKDEKGYKYDDKNEKASDESRRQLQPSSLPPNDDNDHYAKVTKTSTKFYAYTQQKASHSLLKVSDVKKEFQIARNNNDNNDNKRQCCNTTTTTTTTTLSIATVSDKNSSCHLVEDDAFRASQRLKRLEENFKDLTVVRKSHSNQQPSLIIQNFYNGAVAENRTATKLTRSLIALQSSAITKNEEDKKYKNVKSSSKSSCNCDSINQSLSSEQEKRRKSSSTTTTTNTTKNNDVIKNIETDSPVINKFPGDNNNNNITFISKSDSCFHNNNISIESHVSSYNSFVNNKNRLACKSSALNSPTRNKDIFYISRPVPSISEFDVRNLSNSNRTNQFSNQSVTFECYDELFDDDDEDADGYTENLRSRSASLIVNVGITNDDNDECQTGQNGSECNFCQKCGLITFKSNEAKINQSSVYINNNHQDTHSLDFRTSLSLDRLPGNNFESEMREINGTLRGLLKKPNRPPPARKNRVVFDETRNEFFEADYIILIREDCAYDEEDEEPCTCGEHELVRLCCEEGCQCNYTNEDTRTPQSPKFAPPIDFVDEAALSPPDGYKDNGLKNSLGGALSGHIFGAQHIQQLQVIQRLQQQRAAMLAARNNNPTSQSPLPPNATTATTAATAGQQPSGPVTTHSAAQPLPPHTAAGVVIQPQPLPQPQMQPQSPDDDSQPVCTECAECVECAAKQLHDSECTSPQCQEEVAQLSVPTVALVPLHSNSPERRITQKEIIAGEERPKYVLQAQYKPVSDEKDKIISVHKNQRFVVETITMTTVTERRIVREATEDITTTSSAPVILQTAEVTAPSIISSSVASATASIIAAQSASTASTTHPAINSGSESTELIPEPKPPIPPKESSPTQISGILKGGKLWKQESISQSDDMNTSSEDDANAKRSVRFVTEDALATSRDGDGQAAPDSPEHDSQINELIPIKKHSTLFTNALRPNSAVRQLFPSSVHQTSSMLTHEALRAFDESKRAGNLLPNMVGGNPGDSDTVRRSIERNILRRSLIKKKAIKSDISLEDRIKQLTCDIDESNEDPGQDSNDENGKINIYNGEPSAHRDSPTGEENPNQKYSNDKSFSPSSSVSSSSSGSSSAYKKISDIFNRDKKQEKIMEMEENPIVIIPQECRCPAAPDLGMGIQVPVVHTQIHRTPPRQTEPKRQFLSTLAPLTACVAGQKDDLSSYYTLAAGEGHSPANTHFAQYNMSDMEPILCNDEMRKVAPDVIAGTPGQEQDELAAFAQQEANRTDKIKKRYTNENSNASSDDDEQNDYGFNKRPSVRGIKPKFSSTNEILQQMQDQLNKTMPSLQSNTSIKSYTLPKQASSSSINKQIQNVQPQNQQPQNQIPAATAISQQQTERTWSFYGDPEQQRIPLDGTMHPSYYHTMPTVFQQTFQGQEETLMYQNCVTMEQHYGRYARSPTRRPESPPPLRNYHQTMVLIPCNAETYSQFAATSVDPKVAQIQRQNILEYQQVTQQTIRVPISYALPAMQLHVVAGRGHTTQQYVQHQQQQHLPSQQQPQQRILAPRYSMPQDGTMGFSERGVPEGAAAVSHTDCKGIVSPTSQAGQQSQQQQQQQQQQMPNCNQSTVTSTGPPGSVYYAMNV